jgi:hypothetical protein
VLYIWGKKKLLWVLYTRFARDEGLGEEYGVGEVWSWFGDIKLLECMCYVRGCRRLGYWRNAGCVVLRRGTGRPAVVDADVDSSRTFGELSLQRSLVLHT